jgi:hypothetical protein
MCSASCRKLVHLWTYRKSGALYEKQQSVTVRMAFMPMMTPMLQVLAGERKTADRHLFHLWLSLQEWITLRKFI